MITKYYTTSLINLYWPFTHHVKLWFTIPWPFRHTFIHTYKIHSWGNNKWCWRVVKGVKMSNFGHVLGVTRICSLKRRCFGSHKGLSLKTKGGVPLKTTSQPLFVYGNLSFPNIFVGLISTFVFNKPYHF